MQPSGRRRRRNRFNRVRTTKNVVLGLQVVLVGGLAAYLVYTSGFSVTPLYVPLNRVLHLLLLTLVVVSLEAFVFRALEMKYAYREGQRYLQAEANWRKAKKAVALGVLVVFLLLVPPVKTTTLNLIAPQDQLSLDVNGTHPIRFPNQDLLGITASNALTVTVQNGVLGIGIRDDAGVVAPTTEVRSGEREVLPLAAGRYAVYEVLFENRANATTTFTYRVTVGLPPTFTDLMTWVAGVLVVANLGWLAYLRPRRAVHAARRAGNASPGPSGYPRQEGGVWYQTGSAWTPAYAPWKAFPDRGQRAPATPPVAATQELPPPPPQVEPYNLEAPPPPPDVPAEDPDRSLLREVIVNIASLMEKARDRVAAGEYQEALEDYETVLHFDTGNLRAYLMKADLLERLQRPREALEALEAALDRDAHHHRALLRKGRLLEAQGRLDEALDCYETVLRGGPAYQEALVRKGDLMAEVGEAELAWEAYNEALRLTPGDPEIEERLRSIESSQEAPLDRARRHRGEGRTAEAEAAYLRATEGEHRPQALRELADLYLERGRTEEALSHLDEAILETPRDVDLHLKRAEVLAEVGRLADALDACEGVTDLDADSARAWALKGALEARLDLRGKAMVSLEQALELHPDDGESRRLLDELRRRAEEEEDLARVLREVEDFPEEAASVLVSSFGSVAELKRAKVRSLAELDLLNVDLAKRVLKHVRKRK